MSQLPLIMEPSELHTLITQGKAPLIVDLSTEARYRQGHVPGAVHIPAQMLLCNRPPAPGRIAPVEQLNRLFSYLGMTPDTHVVVYDDEGGGWAGRFIWTLDAIGHSRYSYLNGGLQAWLGDELPTSTEIANPDSKDIEVEINPDLLIEIPDILAQLNFDDLVIWDARSPGEYRGEKVFAERGGHIPGAINCEWTQLMDRERGLRIRADARAFLAGLGITEGKKIITHCQSHHRSGFTYLVGKSLGLDIYGYHGSWAEWGNHPETPVEL